MNSSPLQESRLEAGPSTEGSLVFEKTLVTLSQKDYIELKWQASFWKAQHGRIATREGILKEVLKQKSAAISNLKHHLRTTERNKTSASLQRLYNEAIVKIENLKEELKHKEAIICDLKQRLYGKKSEKGLSKLNVNPTHALDKPKRSRGQQQDSIGHGRSHHPNLPVIHEMLPLSEIACRICGLEYSSLSEETSDVIEIEVAAHIRRIIRQKCVVNCACIPGPKILIAPAPRKLIPRSPYGNSVWEELLLRKFLQDLPVNRTLQDFKSLGFRVPAGTVAGGFQKLKPLFEPVYKAFHQQQMTKKDFIMMRRAGKFTSQLKVR